MSKFSLSVVRLEENVLATDRPDPVVPIQFLVVGRVPYILSILLTVVVMPVPAGPPIIPAFRVFRFGRLTCRATGSWLSMTGLGCFLVRCRPVSINVFGHIILEAGPTTVTLRRLLPSDPLCPA